MTQKTGKMMTHMKSRALALSVAAFAVLAGMAPLKAQDAADIILRLDRLEAENRRLTGQLDEIRFQNRKLEDQLKRFQTDADTRFRDLESGTRSGGGGGGGLGGGAAPPAAPRVVPTTPGKRTDAYDPAQNGSAPGAPRPLGGNAAAPGDIGAPLDMTRGGNPAVAGGNPSLAGAAPGTDAKSSFDYARGLIERGEYENGEVSMREFQRKFAKDKRGPEATFWIGESYLRRTRYREAAESFLTVTTKHSGIAKAPEAMLKLGISLRGLGATSEACGTFDQVNRKYPKASVSIKQAVEREKARAKCT